MTPLSGVILRAQPEGSPANAGDQISHTREIPCGVYSASETKFLVRDLE
jgi:hypothetical protein